jgi:hypothetical protein
VRLWCCQHKSRGATTMRASHRSAFIVATSALRKPFSAGSTSAFTSRLAPDHPAAAASTSRTHPPPKRLSHCRSQSSPNRRPASLCNQCRPGGAGRFETLCRVGRMIMEIADQLACFDSRAMSGRILHCRALGWAVRWPCRLRRRAAWLIRAKNSRRHLELQKKGLPSERHKR